MSRDGNLGTGDGWEFYGGWVFEGSLSKGQGECGFQSAAGGDGGYEHWGQRHAGYSQTLSTRIMCGLTTLASNESTAGQQSVR